MKTISVQLPDDLISFAENQAASRGHSDLGEFIGVLATDALGKLQGEEDNKRKKDGKEQSHSELEEMLLVGIEQLERGEGKEMTKDDWDRIRDNYWKKIKLAKKP